MNETEMEKAKKILINLYIIIKLKIRESNEVILLFII